MALLYGIREHQMQYLIGTVCKFVLPLMGGCFLFPVTKSIEYPKPLGNIFKSHVNRYVRCMYVYHTCYAICTVHTLFSLFVLHIIIIIIIIIDGSSIQDIHV